MGSLAQATKWAEYDVKNKPINQVCLNCWESIQEMAPTHTVDQIAAMRDSKNPTDVTFMLDFESGRLIKQGEAEKRKFMPASDVTLTSQYGLQVYFKVGLVTESELARLTGCTGKLAKPLVEPISVRLDGPKSLPTKLWPISLKGLSAEETAGMLKAKITHDSFASHQESLLRADNQISQSQGLNLFGVSAEGLNENRISIRNPSKIPTVAQLIEVKKEATTATVQQAEEEVESSEEEPGSGAEEAAALAASAKAAPKFSLGSHQTASKQVRKTGKSRTAAATSSAPGKAVGVSTRGDSPAKSSSKISKRNTKQDRLVEEAETCLADDREMLRVAKKHLATPKGSSSVCLAELRVSIVLNGTRLGNTLTGVGCCQKSFGRL